MAVRGAKPKPHSLKVVTGNPGKRPLPADDTDDEGKLPEGAVREEPLEPPKRLTKLQERHWRRFIDKAWWLTDHDVPKAYAWVCLWCEFLSKPKDMNSARISQMRILASELGLDPGERARMGVSGGSKENPNDKFFD